MKHPTQLILATILLIAFASSAFASFAIIPGAKQANLSRNDSIGLQFQIKNLGYDEICLNLETEQNDSYIETNLSEDSMCLNGNESANTTVTIRTENAPRGLQTVTLEAESSEEIAFAIISIYVSEEPEIELVAYSNDICRGTKDHINVLVRNNSDEFKEVRLQAENEMLLPYFERQTLSLIPFEEKYVELNVHPSPYSAEGTHIVSMMAITDDEIVKETVVLDVEDCGEERDAEFSLDVSTRCLDVEKSEDEKIYFTVKNKLDTEQKVYFSAGGELAARLSTDSAWLEGDEEREFYFEVNVDQDARVKDYNVALRVWNSSYGLGEDLCIRPEKAHSVDIRIEENNLELSQWENAVFTVVLENGGDYSEEFELEIDNDYDNIEVILSDDEIDVERHGSREVYISVNALQEAAEGFYNITFKADTGRDEFEAELYFEVIEAEEIPDVPEQAIEITGYATSINMDENTEKSIFVTVKNNSNTLQENIRVELTGLPDGIAATWETSLSLVPGQEKTVKLNIIADNDTNGEYWPELKTWNAEQSDERSVTLIVEAVEEEEQANANLAGLVGLFAAGGSALLGLALLVIVVLALVLISRASRNPSTQKKDEIWMRGQI